jgi:uncharacterized protein DUF6249
MRGDTGPFFVLMVLFISIAYTIKVIVEARARTKLLQANPQEELVRSMLKGEERTRRQTSLRWGIVLTFLGAGFLILHLMQIHDPWPGGFAVLLTATGLGNIVSYLVSRKIEDA